MESGVLHKCLHRGDDALLQRATVTFLIVYVCEVPTADYFMASKPRVMGEAMFVSLLRKRKHVLRYFGLCLLEIRSIRIDDEETDSAIGLDEGRHNQLFLCCYR